ncbi:SOUL family heme-binding protein [Pseudoroseicyclus sp. H15]
MSLLSRITPNDITFDEAGAPRYRGYEVPPFTIERTLGEVEIRRYAPHILAEVTVQASRDDALRAGFRKLAGYIFGGNSKQQSVAMTAPVSQRESQTIDMTAPVSQRETASGEWTVSFTMPAEWTMERLPQPNAGDIRFRETPAERRAVLGFPGRASDAALEKAEAELRDVLAREGLAPTGPVQRAFYDDPMTLPWARHNEVSLPLD